MYVKLFAQILDSSIWLESGDTRIVWITLLAAMDQDGFARFAMVENLARRANVSTDACSEAVKILESPDTNSSDDANEGRRIERVPGGWMVLNSQKYRDLGRDENRREKTRERVARWKKAQKESGNAKVTIGNAEVRKANAGVRKSNDMQKQKQKKKEECKNTSKNVVVGNSLEKTRRVAKPTRASTALDDVFLESLRINPAYSAINVELELGKAQSWCSVNHRVCTRRFFVNWLNRVEKPLAIPKPQSRVGAQAKPVAVENDRVDTAEMVSTWNDLADAMGEPLEKLVKKSVALGQLSKDDARMILGESNAQ